MKVFGSGDAYSDSQVCFACKNGEDAGEVV